METEQTAFEQQMLNHAAQQTKFLQNISWIVTALFILGLIGAGIGLISLAS